MQATIGSRLVQEDTNMEATKYFLIRFKTDSTRQNPNDAAIRANNL